jgi:hypothetical protein
MICRLMMTNLLYIFRLYRDNNWNYKLIITDLIYISVHDFTYHINVYATLIFAPSPRSLIIHKTIKTHF